MLLPEKDKTISACQLTSECICTATGPPPLRIVVSCNCNFRCPYCSVYGENLYQVGNPLPIEVLLEAIRIGYKTGIRDFRLTGGEPLLEKDRLGAILQSLPNSADVHLTTNGIALSQEAAWLRSFKKLALVKVSLDTVDADVFRKITGVDALTRVIQGIAAARGEGLRLRINTVVSTLNVKHLWELLGWCEKSEINVKLFDINFYEHPGENVWQELYVSLSAIRSRLASEASTHRVSHGIGGYGIPMDEYKWGQITVTLKDSNIGTTYGSICDGCSYMWRVGASHYCQEALYNLTLTVDGKLIICRHRADLAVPLRHRAAKGQGMLVAFTEALARYRSAKLLLHLQ